MPDLVPSTNELNIFGLIELRSLIFRYLSRMSHTRVGRGAVVVRLVARALAGGDHLEAAGARPVDVLADQRRLVAPGEAVDDARGLRLARQQRTGERIRLDVDHDDVLAVRDRRERMADAGVGIAGRLDRSPRSRGARSPPRHRPSTMGRGRSSARRQRLGGELLRGPAGGAELRSRARDIEVGDGRPRACPCVRRTCARNMVPNLPAPIRPTVTGRPAAFRSSSRAWRFTGNPSGDHTSAIPDY